MNTDKSIDQLYERICKIEKSNKRYKLFNLILLLIILSVSFISWQIKTIPDVISAQKFRLLDEKGNERDTFDLGKYNSPLIKFFKDKKVELAIGGYRNEKSEIYFSNENFVLSINPSGGYRHELFDIKNELCLQNIYIGFSKDSQKRHHPRICYQSLNKNKGWNEEYTGLYEDYLYINGKRIE